MSHLFSGIAGSTVLHCRMKTTKNKKSGARIKADKGCCCLSLWPVFVWSLAGVLA